MNRIIQAAADWRVDDNLVTNRNDQVRTPSRCGVLLVNATSYRLQFDREGRPVMSGLFNAGQTVWRILPPMLMEGEGCLVEIGQGRGRRVTVGGMLCECNNFSELCFM